MRARLPPSRLPALIPVLDNVIDVALDRLTSRSPVPRSPESVTSIRAEAEAHPREVGMDPDGPERIWAAAVRLYQSGLHPAIQICVRRRGKVVLDRAIGHASGNGPGDPPEERRVRATTDTLFNIFSASKAVTAMVIHLLDQRHSIHLDDPISEYLPEYAAHGKDGITIRHVLTHRAGVPNLPEGVIDLDRLADQQWILDMLCQAKPTWRPGRWLGYHAITGGFILGELVRRVTGKDIRTVLAEEILRPLGFRWTNYGVSPDDVHRVAVNYFTGPPVLPPLSSVFRRVLGVELHRAIELSNDPRFLTAVVPAGNVITTADELSRFFQLLLDGGEQDGVRIFEPRTIRRATAEQSYLEFDFTLGLPLRYSMGFMLGAEWFSLFGPDTEHAFGHVGFTNVIAWADPERRVAAAVMTTGKPVIYPQIYFLWEIMRQIGLACPKEREVAGLKVEKRRLAAGES